MHSMCWKKKTVTREFYIQQKNSSKLRRGKGQGGLLSPFVFNIVLKFLARAIKQEKKKEERKKQTQIGKENYYFQMI